MKRIEVSHRIEMGMKTYPGLPEPRAEVLMDYDPAKYGGLSEFYIASLHCCGNTGTYVDAPIHRWRGAAELLLERVAHVPVIVVEAMGEMAIGPERFRGLVLGGGEGGAGEDGMEPALADGRVLRSEPASDAGGGDGRD